MCKTRQSRFGGKVALFVHYSEVHVGLVVTARFRRMGKVMVLHVFVKGGIPQSLVPGPFGEYPSRPPPPSGQEGVAPHFPGQYAAGGTCLAVTQEDYLVGLFFCLELTGTYSKRSLRSASHIFKIKKNNRN